MRRAGGYEHMSGAPRCDHKSLAVRYSLLRQVPHRTAAAHPMLTPAVPIAVPIAVDWKQDRIGYLAYFSQPRCHQPVGCGLNCSSLIMHTC